MIQPAIDSVPAPRADSGPCPDATQLALALLDGAATLHGDPDRLQVASLAVLAVERACPTAAAALFEWLESAGVIALRAAGPRWRTAERETPTWLARECGAVAQLLRGVAVAGTSGCGPHATGEQPKGGAHLIAVPVPVGAGTPTVLVVAWPAPAQPAAHASTLLGRFARHVGMALSRQVPPDDVDQAGSELAHALEDERRSQQLHLLGELARGLVHDLNNSMTTIVGTADWLMHAVDDQSLRSDLERLRNAALDAAGLVKRVRLLRASGDRGREVVELGELAESAIDIVRGRGFGGALPTSAAIDLRTAPGAAVHARVNPLELREVLVDLIINAVEAMHEGGDVVLATGGDACEGWIEVRDTGDGIPAALRDRVFDPFVTSRDRHGAGLGLSVAWSIARAHGGRVEIADRPPGTGAVLRVILPRATPPRSTLPLAAVTTQVPAAARRILLVEDQDDVRRSVADMIAVLGHHVVEAADATEALARFDGCDLVITDWGMPGQNGIELARELTRQRSELPVLLLTGWGAMLGSSPDPAIRRVVAKPVTLDALEAAIASAMHPQPLAGGEAA